MWDLYIEDNTGLPRKYSKIIFLGKKTMLSVNAIECHMLFSLFYVELYIY
jgi:hypothetical protein